MHGRGASENPENRFDQLHVEPDLTEGPPASTPTRFYKDKARTILAKNDSPDIGFRFDVNPYRGCEHGCSYCFARPSHEYLGFSAGLDFETRITVKSEAPELLRAGLMHRNWEPQVVALSGNTDCYQPVERKLEITRRCLQVFAEFRNPVGIITKSDLVTRDIDILLELQRYSAIAVNVSLTTLSVELAGKMEPRAARPQRRLQAIKALADAGIAVGVMTAPIIPGLNDAEIPTLLAAAADAGAKWAHWSMVRLAAPLPGLFDEWLEAHFPDRRAKIWSLIRESRGGKDNDSRFGVRHRGEGPYAQQIAHLYRAAERKHFSGFEPLRLSTEHFRRPPRPGDQLELI